MATTDGLFAEGLLAAAVQTNPDIRERLETFFSKKTKRLEPGSNGQRHDLPAPCFPDSPGDEGRGGISVPGC